MSPPNHQSSCVRHFASLLGCTPLHSAAYIGSTATVKLLLEFQAEPKQQPGAENLFLVARGDARDTFVGASKGAVAHSGLIW